jgi:hypothetical protein
MSDEVLTALARLEAKVDALAARIGAGGTSPDTSTFREGIGEPANDLVPYVRLAFADQFRGQKNQDGNPIALPEFFVYSRTRDVWPLTADQEKNLVMNTGQNASQTLVGRWGAVFNFVPDQSASYGSNVMGLVADNDDAMKAEITALVNKLIAERGSETREDFDK